MNKELLDLFGCNLSELGRTWIKNSDHLFRDIISSYCVRIAGGNKQKLLDLFNRYQGQ